MARFLRSILALACAAVVAVKMMEKCAFVPPARSAPQGLSPVATGIAAGSLLALPAWAYNADAIDAQLLLARIPGGKMTKERNLVVPSPEEDGFSDAQVALCLCIALVGLLAAVDLAFGMNKGLTPLKDKTFKNKGRITPLVKRFIEMGY